MKRVLLLDYEELKKFLDTDHIIILRNPYSKYVYDTVLTLRKKKEKDKRKKKDKRMLSQL